MSLLEIRRAILSDRRALESCLRRLDLEVRKGTAGLWDREPGTLSSRALLTEPHVTALMAFQGRRAVGCIVGRIERRRSRPRRVGHILYAWVDPGFRRRRIGSTMLRELIGRWTTHRISEVSLRYATGNERARSFWQGLGFRPIIAVANTSVNALQERLDSRKSGHDLQSESTSRASVNRQPSTVNRPLYART